MENKSIIVSNDKLHGNVTTLQQLGRYHQLCIAIKRSKTIDLQIMSHIIRVVYCLHFENNINIVIIC